MEVVSFHRVDVCVVDWKRQVGSVRDGDGKLGATQQRCAVQSESCVDLRLVLRTGSTVTAHAYSPGLYAIPHFLCTSSYTNNVLLWVS